MGLIGSVVVTIPFVFLTLYCPGKILNVNAGGRRGRLLDMLKKKLKAKAGGDGKKTPGTVSKVLENVRFSTPKKKDDKNPETKYKEANRRPTRIDGIVLHENFESEKAESERVGSVSFQILFVALDVILHRFSYLTCLFDRMPIWKA